jgi:PadR family transcriptional regulator PadR
LGILRRLAENSALIVPEGTVYPLLSRLKAEGLLASEWVEADAGHPRKYYKLTASGRRRAVQMAQFWSTFSANLDRMLAPLRKEEG